MWLDTTRIKPEQFDTNVMCFSSSNININDILGNYSLTLVDSLDTLAVRFNSTVPDV